MATLVPCLVTLRSEFNALFPDRDKASDGWIGDPAHQARDSDHNPDDRGLVHAIDVDKDLLPLGDMQAFVDHLVARAHAGLEKRLTYVIYNRRIWSASHGWVGRAYTGSNPHDKHAHFSASDSPSREQNVANWRLEEVPVALTADDKKWLTAQIDARADRLAADLLGAKISDKANPGRTVGDVLRDAAKLRGVLVGDQADTANAALPADSPLGQLLASVKPPA